MTLEQQVHQQEVTIRQLQDKIARLERIVDELGKDSHPPVDFLDRVAEAIRSGELRITGVTSGSHTRINNASVSLK